MGVIALSQLHDLASAVPIQQHMPIPRGITEFALRCACADNSVHAQARHHVSGQPRLSVVAGMPPPQMYVIVVATAVGFVITKQITTDSLCCHIAISPNTVVSQHRSLKGVDLPWLKKSLLVLRPLMNHPFRQCALHTSARTVWRSICSNDLILRSLRTDTYY